MSQGSASSGLAAALHKVLALHKAHMTEEAAVAAAEILARYPEQPDALNFLAVSRRAQGRWPEAAELYRRALTIRPELPELHNNLGNVLKDLRDEAGAEAAYIQALQLKPDYVDAAFSLARLQGEMTRYAQAEAGYRRVLALRPDHIEAQNNLANTLRELGRVDEAIALFEEVLKREPRLAAAHYNLGWAHYLSGNLPAGGPHYEWRWELEEFQARRNAYAPIPLWRKGDDIAGKTILLTHEQGLGDTVQFLRLARLVKQHARHVMVEIPPLLRWIIPLVRDEVEIFATNDKKPVADLRAPLMSLPYLLGLDYAEFPPFPPYLEAPPHAGQWAARLGGKPGLKAGLFWQGNPKTNVDRGRSFPLLALEPLAHLPGLRLISLQTWAGLEQLENLPPHFHIENLAPDYANDDSLALYDTAGVMANLDLVITADAGTAHIAGAMGVPTWVMLRKVPEWRWGRRGETTPWYGHMRLFRQEKDGDWSAPVHAMMAALKDLR